VFLAHNRVDGAAVVQLDSRLRDNGISTWRDADQVPPGRWFQDVLQEAIGKVRRAAIIIGPTGLGRWERLELRSFVSRCVTEGLPVIPVLKSSTVLSLSAASRTTPHSPTWCGASPKIVICETGFSRIAGSARAHRSLRKASAPVDLTV
jgi:TIR domain